MSYKTETPTPTRGGEIEIDGVKYQLKTWQPGMPVTVWVYSDKIIAVALHNKELVEFAPVGDEWFQPTPGSPAVLYSFLAGAGAVIIGAVIGNFVLAAAGGVWAALTVALGLLRLGSDYDRAIERAANIKARDDG